MWGVGGGDSAVVLPHSMGGFRGGEEGHTQEHAQERTRECCTYPLATYPSKVPELRGRPGRKWVFIFPGILQSESCASFSSWRCESQCEFLGEFRCEFPRSAVAFLGGF